MSSFNIHSNQDNLPAKITTGFERVSEVFKSLLWEKAKKVGLSPIQIQILIFIKNHKEQYRTVSYLAKEFNLTKATVSDAVKVLLQKKLIEKKSSAQDARSYSISLSLSGINVLLEVENFADPLQKLVNDLSFKDQEDLYHHLTALIDKLLKTEVITVQRNCNNCKFFEEAGNTFYCNFLNKPLQQKDLRLDCPEFETIT